MAASHGDGLAGKTQSKAHLLCCLASPEIPHGWWKIACTEREIRKVRWPCRLWCWGARCFSPTVAPVPCPAWVVLVKWARDYLPYTCSVLGMDLKILEGGAGDLSGIHPCFEFNCRAAPDLGWCRGGHGAARCQPAGLLLLACIGVQCLRSFVLLPVTHCNSGPLATCHQNVK